MPDQNDNDAINGLFDRIEDVARQSAPRDGEAERLIQQRLRDYPPAPYYMAQTILIQEEALRQAREQIEQLEGQSKRSGGFLAGLRGEEPQRRAAERQRGPWGYADQGQEDRQAQRRGGGFLAGAAQTALGVTGGVLLGSAIAGMLTGGAYAQEEEPADADTGAEADAGTDLDAGDDFGGGDFDMGGDF